MAHSRVDIWAESLSLAKQRAIRKASEAKVTSRQKAADAYFGDALEALRENASSIRNESLDRLQELLTQFESIAQAHGMHVHWAESSSEARSHVAAILASRAQPGELIAKGKSMATEEIHLNAHLESLGYVPIETDLGEFVVQLDGDTPSHIVTPIIHKSRFDVAELFAQKGIGPYSEDPEELTMQARKHLRKTFQQAAVGISGANFLVAETGQLVIVENEGNNRFSTTAPRTHIAVVGIEKVIARLSDLAPLLRLLALSSTGQQLTTYTHFIGGPKGQDSPDGPEEVHVILLDNGRTRALNGPCRDILKCIRCGACLNVCPVYRAASGHAYQHVYPGPMGAVWVPATQGEQAYGDVAFASTLCGACDSVCPVRIPLSQLLVKLRHQSLEANSPYQGFAEVATKPWLWKAGMTMLPVAKGIPHTMVEGFEATHEWPEAKGPSFRRWWRERT